MNKPHDDLTFAKLQGFYEYLTDGPDSGRTHETNAEWNEAYDQGRNEAEAYEKDMPFTSEDIKLLEDLVSLGGTKAEEVMTRGHRSYDPLPKDRMLDLAWGGYGRAFEVLKQLKLMQEGRSS